MRSSLTASLHARGFDLSHPVPFERGAVVRCSQCEAVSICGVPCHETGCPNETQECLGCDARIPARRYARYCAECMS